MLTHGGTQTFSEIRFFDCEVEMKNMILDELMAVPVTDELILEVSYRVWEAQEIELLDPCDGELIDYDGQYALCGRCGYTADWGEEFEHTQIPPDITRPENFWPLVEELLFDPEWAGLWGGKEGELGITLTIGDKEVEIINKVYGLTIAFAFLKIKELENGQG